MSIDAHTQRKREARLRYHLLDVLYQSRGNEHGGWVTGRFAMDAMSWLGADLRFKSDAHAISLLRDLVNCDFAVEEDNREDESQPWGIDHLTWRITGDGSKFIARALPPQADIDDGRFL